MTNIILCGCSGHMGHVVTEIAAADAEVEIVAGIDLSGTKDASYPVFASLKDCDVKADALIDFSSPKALDAILTYCMEKNVPAVLCTTGYTDAQMEQIREAGKKVAVMKSANMSLGVNMLLKLLKEAARTLAPAGFDIEIVEKHHNRKVDAPSGTALAMADSMNEALGNVYTYQYDRSQRREKRDPQEIGISAVRGGSIVGEQEVLFAGRAEIVEFKHTAYSRGIFAKGAVQAAKFMAGKPAGFYDMSDVIG